MKILQTDRLYLRELETDDIEQLSSIYSDIEVMKFIGTGITFDKEQTAKSIDKWKGQLYKEWGFGIWGVVEKEKNILIGQCGFNILKENSEIEIAYLFAKKFWGKGYATEISKAALEYGFNELNFNKIVALTYPENISSMNVIKKLGMQFEGEHEFFGKKMNYFTRHKPDIK